MSHNHSGEQLTTGCPACMEARDAARWANAPEAIVHWHAYVSGHIATINGKRIEWNFTTTQPIPLDVTADELERLEERSDIGAALYISAPPSTDDSINEAIACANVNVSKIERPSVQTPCETLAMF